MSTLIKGINIRTSQLYILNQGLIDSFGEEGMQLPISIMQMRLCSSKNSNSILYSPGNQQLRLRIDLKMGGGSP